MPRFFAGFVAFVLAAWLAGPAIAGERILVFGAASMKDALEAAGRDYQRQTGDKLVFSFASSSVLAKQIAAGAPADLYVSANIQWADWLGEHGLGDNASRRNIAGNNIVIAGRGSGAKAEGPEDLLSGGKFAMGDPSHVPAGRYARLALKEMGLWEKVRANAVYGENVRVALAYVERGELATAIVYSSDLVVAPELTALYKFPPSSHPPIVYPALIPVKGDMKAKGFLDFLSGRQGQAVLARYGFLPAGG